MRACTCPNCGAQLKVDNDDREFIYCEFCGTRIDLVDRRTVHTEHIIDDAKIKNAENISRIVNIFAAPVERNNVKKNSSVSASLKKNVGNMNESKEKNRNVARIEKQWKMVAPPSWGDVL